MQQRGVGILAALAVAAGLVVAVPGFRLGAHATAPTPGIVTSFAGGSTTGYATSISQAPWGLAWAGTSLLISDDSGLRILALDPATGVETVVAGNGQAGPSGDGGPATAAAIGFPRHLARDGSGDVFFVADDRVREILANGTITTLAGAGLLSGAHGVAVDTAGNVFIADTGHHTIRKVAGGVLTTIAGTAGSFGYSGDGGPATAALLKFPDAVAVDGSGNVFIADTGNSVVREIDHSTGVITTVAGTGSTGGACATGAATTTPLFSPVGLAFDSGGHLLITDMNDGCVRSLSSATLTAVAHFNQIQSAVADASGNIDVARTSAGPNGGLVLKFTAPTTSTVIAGTNGSSCRVYGIGGPATSAMLCQPYDLMLDPGGNLYIADIMADQVLKVDTGGSLTVIAGTGQHGYAGDGGPATSAQLNGPTGLAMDASGNLFISDSGNSMVWKLDHTTGNIATFAGTPTQYGFAGDGLQATSAKFFDNQQIAFDGAGDLLIADLGNHRVRKVAPNGIITTFAGDGSTAFDPFNGEPATSAHVNGPTGVVADSLGNVFISQTGPTLRVDSSGNIWQYSNLLAIHLAMASGNRLVGTSDCEVALIQAAVAALSLGGTNAVPCGGNSGDGGPARSAQFNTLYGVAVDSAGDVFVADTYNKRVRRIQAYTAPVAPTAVSALAARNRATVQWTAPSDNGGLPILDYAVVPYTGATPHTAVHVSTTSTPVTGLANGTTYTFTVTASNGWATGPESAHSAPVTPVLTTPGTILTFAGGPGTGAGTGIGQLPYAIAADNNGNDLYIGDLANPVVRDLNLTNNQESVLAGNDGYGFAGDGGPPLSALIQGAGAIAACGGYTYLADTLNYVIRIVDHNTGKIRTVAGTGTPGYSGDGGPGTQAQISRVLGLACRTGGGVYISDSDNGAVRILDQSGAIHTWWKGFSFPTGLVELPTGVDDVAMADAGADNAILELTDTQLYLLAGTPGHAGNTGDGGLAYQALLNNPRAVALFGTWPYTWMYVADTGNNRVRLVDFQNLSIHSFAGGFNQPTGLAIPNTTLYVADTGNFRVAAVPAAGGTPTTVAGNGTPSLGGDGGPAASAEMGNPYAVALDGFGNEYIADNQDNAIRKVDTSGTITTFVAPAALNDPRGVAVDAAGNVYISDSGSGRVLEYDPAGNFKQTIASGLSHPRGLVVDAQGHVFIADTGNNRVVKVTPPGAIVPFAGTGAAGFSGDGGPATGAGATLNGPRAVAIDVLGNVYISDSQNNRVREVTLDGNIHTVVGTGTAGPGGDGGLATAAQLSFPFGLGFDGAGNLYIADTANQRLRVVDSLGRISTVMGACSVAGFSGDGGPASTAQLNGPFGIAVDAAGDVYVADVNNNRVRGAYALPGVRTATCQGPAGSPASRGTNPTQSPAPPPPPRVMDGGGVRTLPATIQPSRAIAAKLPVRIKRAEPKATLAVPPSTGAQPATKAQSPPSEPPAVRLPTRMAAIAEPSPAPGPPYLQLLAAAGALCVIVMAALRLRRRRRPI